VETPQAENTTNRLETPAAHLPVLLSKLSTFYDTPSKIYNYYRIIAYKTSLLPKFSPRFARALLWVVKSKVWT